MKLLSVSLLFALVLPLSVQQPATSTASAPARIPASANITFAFDWPQGVPWEKYSINVQADGKSRFDGVPHPDETNDTDPYRQDFTMSDANRQKLFDLAQKLNYFNGDFDSHLKRIARTGIKTLQYQSPQVNASTSYNWSQNPEVQQLTQLFTGIAMTVDYGRKLAFQYRFDKLGIDQRLKELEELQATHGVEELGIIAPILHKIATDPNMMNISRESAKRLLLSINPPPSPGSNQDAAQ